MKRILCFGDSNTWGLIPGTDKRFADGVRWTSIIRNDLEQSGYEIIEEGLCGRTTVFEDPDRIGRAGDKLLPVFLESHAPLDMVIIMLGTNGFGARGLVLYPAELALHRIVNRDEQHKRPFSSKISICQTW